jgi:hypothetical protein
MKNFLPLSGPLEALEDANRDARLALTGILSENGVNVDVDNVGSDSSRGLAFFFAFDPWMTSLRCPQGSVGFFSAARQNNLIDEEDAHRLQDALASIGRHVASKYEGAFENFFKDRKVSQGLNAKERRLARQAGMPVMENWVDSLFEACPFPLHPVRHLTAQYFTELEVAEEVAFHSRSDWLIWTEALDLVCLGPWAGLKPDSILEMIEALKKSETGATVGPIENSFIGHKVTLPVSSRGLQGIVFGFFRNPPADKVRIFQSLLQFGGAMADVYADLRWPRFVEAMRNERQSEAEIAREVVNVVSPIGRVIVRRDGKVAGYKILEQEGGYWGGYEELSEFDLSEDSFKLTGPKGLEIFIEPVEGLASLLPDFVKLRLQSNLERALAQASQPPRENEILPEEDVEDLLSRFQELKGGTKSVPKLRKYYVVSRVKNHWKAGEVRIANSALKKFLEQELGHDVGSGFQITSFINEAEDIFSRKVKVTKDSPNSISLSWNTGQ